MIIRSIIFFLIAWNYFTKSRNRIETGTETEKYSIWHQVSEKNEKRGQSITLLYVFPDR